MMSGNRKSKDFDRLDRAVADAQQNRLRREQGYREQALKLFPWVCGRCQREFTRDNVRELTVHHRDHDHDNNPADGSNWELLCIYCHENEHARYLEEAQPHTETRSDSSETATHKPFSGLDALLKKDR